MALFRMLTPLKKRWACQISMDAARDDALLAAMKKAGCFLVLMGFESLNRESLKEMHKSANAAADYDAVAEKYNPAALRYGINTVDGEEIYYIPNPALGLWIDRERFEP